METKLYCSPRQKEWNYNVTINYTYTHPFFGNGTIEFVICLTKHESGVTLTKGNHELTITLNKRKLTFLSLMLMNSQLSARHLTPKYL